MEPDPSHVRWVRMDGLHLTLRFLGATTDEQAKAISSVLTEIGSATSPIDIVLAGAGAYPSPSRPRALWLGLAQGQDGLTVIADALSRALVRFGWPAEDRPYRPHLTLARTDGVSTGPATAGHLTAAAADLRVGFTAHEIALMESLTGRGPARYESLFTAPLAGEASGP